MKGIAKFFKVSFDEFMVGLNDIKPDISDDEAKAMYDDIKLPKRATKGSAGYDFFAPFSFDLKPGERLDDLQRNGYRSGLGFKYRLQLNNTVGIIDSDYFYSDNEGHIFAKITNDSNEGKELAVDKGSGFIQGIFMEFGTTVDDDVIEERNGGFGSTNA